VAHICARAGLSKDIGGVGEFLEKWGCCWCAVGQFCDGKWQARNVAVVGCNNTKTFRCLQVDKILGPGNQYVTAAKMLLQNSEAMIAMDMPAGPSEVLVIADSGASPVHVAADLLSQAEHGPDSQVGSRA
jgi:Histidinol dehydrogenase